MRIISVDEMVSVKFDNGSVNIVKANDTYHVKYYINFYPIGEGKSFTLGVYDDIEFCKKLLRQLSRLNGYEEVIYVSMPEDEDGKQIKVYTSYEEIPVDVFLNRKMRQYRDAFEENNY